MSPSDAPPHCPDFHAVAQQMCELFEDGSPAVLRGLDGLFHSSEVFDWIRTAHSSEREQQSLQKIRALKSIWGLDTPSEPDRSMADPGRPAEIYRDGAMILDPVPYLPSEKHSNFADWIAQSHKALGPEFGMQAPGVECANWNAFHRLQTLLAPILVHTGPRSYRFNVFLGDYRRTPFGFHIDPHQEAVFQYVLEGSRKGSFWEGLVLQDRDADWVEDSNGLVSPPHAPDATFELTPGDLVFWPGTHVHGFETNGPTMALSIVIDRHSPRNRDDIVTSLEIISAGGKTALPAPDLQAIVGIDDLLRCPSVYPLSYERFDDELIIGACGRSFSWPNRLSNQAATRLFDGLNRYQTSGNTVAVSELAHEYSDATFEEDEVLSTLAILKGFGFLV